MTSFDLITRMTGSPFLTVISLGSKAKRCAVISMVRGVCARSTPANEASVAHRKSVLKQIFSFIVAFLDLTVVFQGARYLRISCSSSALSMARTRMCCNTAFTSRGEIASGGLWQRPQFAWNLCSPSLVFDFLCTAEAGVFAAVGWPCGWANTSREQASSKVPNKIANQVFICVLPATRGRESDTRFARSKYSHYPTNCTVCHSYRSAARHEADNNSDPNRTGLRLQRGVHPREWACP